MLASDPDLAISRIQLEESGYQIRSAPRRITIHSSACGPTVLTQSRRWPRCSAARRAANWAVPISTLLPRLSGLTPYGGTYALNFITARQTTDSTFNTLNPQFPTSLQLNVTQPLWRGLRFDENRYRIQVARKNRQLSAQALRQRVIDVVTQAVQAYWELDYAWNNLNVQAEAVKLAERQYDSNRRQAEQGILAPIDVVAAQTQSANFQQSLFAAQQALTAAENNLKSLMLPNRSDLMWAAALIPETPLDMNVSIPPLEDAVKQAMASRPEVAETSLAIDINGLNTRLAREATRSPHRCVRQSDVGRSGG